MAPKIVSVRSRDGKFLAFENDLITRHLLDFGAHTRNELAMVLDQINEGDTVVDLGAHIGTYTVPMANKIGPGGRLLAIEGNPTTFDLLQRNIEENHPGGRITAICAIVGVDATSSLRRVDMTGNTGAGHYVPDTDAQLVSCNTEALLRDNGFERPDFVKIDVEGMESLVLRSLEPLLAACRPKLYIEISIKQLNRFGSDLADIHQLLRSLKYRFYRNIGERNSSNDLYRMMELASLEEGGEFFDLLALPDR